jgi:hypothetical protein
MAHVFVSTTAAASSSAVSRYPASPKIARTMSLSLLFIWHP